MISEEQLSKQCIPSEDNNNVNNNNVNNNINIDDVVLRTNDQCETSSQHTDLGEDGDDVSQASYKVDQEEETNWVLRQIRLKNKGIFRIEQGVRNKPNGSSSLFKRELLNYNRREKSLEELSKRFLSLFLDKEESLLSLDKITHQLGVERRRIYDIINILESLKLVSRKGKNNYKWNGFRRIYETIQEYIAKGEAPMHDLIDPMECEPNLEMCGAGGRAAYLCNKREKSLEMLSIGFLKLFLHWKPVMTLEEAARRLSSINIDSHKIKTKIRRLYDIANVFKSLGLIKKTTLSDTKKPAFSYVGVSGLDTFADRIKEEQ
jgi:predicted transcriptional regulator